MSDRVPATSPAGDLSLPVAPLLARARWLALADPGGPLDVERLFGHVAVRVETTSSAFAAALVAGQPDFVVLVAPPAHGADVELVGAWVVRGTRAVLISPRGAVGIRLRALELGFVDAIDSDSDPMELVGRLSIASRTEAIAGDQGAVGKTAVIDRPARIAIDPDLELDRLARVVRKNGQILALRPREYELLDFLATHPNRVFTRQELLRHVWHGRTSSERIVDVHVHWLRLRIEADPARPVRLVTVHSAGYRLDLLPEQPDER